MMTVQATTAKSKTLQVPSTPPTIDEARQFVESAGKQLLDLWIKSGRAQWVQETFITDDTEEMAADADEAVKAKTAEQIGRAHV